MPVSIDLDPGLRLVSSTVAGKYDLHEVSLRASGPLKGKPYVRRRHSGLSLEQALVRALDILVITGEEVTSLTALMDSYARAQQEIVRSLREGRSARCNKCKSFKAWLSPCQRCLRSLEKEEVNAEATR